MGFPEKLLDQIFNEHLNNLHTTMPCRVVQYYPSRREADLQPLFQRIIGGEIKDYPSIRKAPVMKSLVTCADPRGLCECGHYMELEAGQVVVAVFAQRALDHVGTRRHDLTDAIVIGVL